MKLLSHLQLTLIFIFTVLETLTLTAWLMILGVSVGASVTTAGLAAGVLFVGLLIEHTIAVAAGDFPQKGAVQPQNGSSGPTTQSVKKEMVNRLAHLGDGPTIVRIEHVGIGSRFPTTKHARIYDTGLDTGESGETYDAEAASAQTETPATQ
jgi:hypothetical protein